MEDSQELNILDILLVTTTKSYTDLPLSTTLRPPFVSESASESQYFYPQTALFDFLYNGHQSEESRTILIVACALVVLIAVTAFLLIMLNFSRHIREYRGTATERKYAHITVYCYMKRSSLYKPAPNDLASLSFSSSLNNQLDLSSHTHHSTIQTNSCGNQLKLEQQQQQQQKSNNSNNSNNSQGGSDTLSHDTLSTVNSYGFNSKSSTHSSSSSTYSAGSVHHHHHPKAHLCLSMPLAKPTLNELKPQLSIESKMKTKSLIERRGSNNSLTLTLNTNKKKTQILNPSKEVEYLSIQTRRLAVNELIEVSKSTSNLYNEFYLLPFNHFESWVPGSSIKNRYKTIVPNEATRVNLPIVNNDPSTSYINANYISGYKCEPKAYIAAQGPMSNTLDDFWRMVWSERVPCIVMNTKLVERNRNKCELYFPEKLESPIFYGHVKVTVKHVNYFDDYDVRQLKVESSNEARVIYHYWYKAWPDHTLPENPNVLLELIKLVESNRKFDDGLVKGPVLVHCSAGVGRTGCFLALSIGIKQIELNGLVDIVKIVSNLRIERGGMIQTLEQYEFIYQVLAFYCMYYKNYPFSASMSVSPTSTVPSFPPEMSCLHSPIISSTFSFN